MLNICMLVHNRPKLTEQALQSLVENTKMDYKLTIIDDYSAPETEQILTRFARNSLGMIARPRTCIGPGAARNWGIEWSKRAFGHLDHLYLCDNDCYFLPGWDKTLLEAWPIAKQLGFKALGGYAHAYQQPISTKNGINELAALGLLSWLMDWDTFDHYGTFDPSPDINGSEDWLYSQKIRRDGFKVGALAEPVIINCGATSSNGKPCPGASTLYEQKIPPGVLIL